MPDAAGVPVKREGSPLHDRERAPLLASVAMVDLCCVLFAAWTVVCNAVVLLGGKSAQLAGAALALVLALGLLAVLAARRGGLGWLRELLRDPTSPPVEPEHERQPWPLVRILLLGAAVWIAKRFDAHRDLNELSALALGFFALSYAAVVRSGRGDPHQPSSGFCEWLLWALALVCAGVTLTLHHPDSDDAFYVNIAVSVVDFPHRALLSTDALYGLGASFGVAAYRAPSVELLSGTISYLTGISALDVSHLVLPTIVGLLTPLALARLLRLLDPQRWPFAVLAVLLYLVYDGGVHGSFGNFSFIRLFQGKAMFITMVAPLIMAHGVRFGLAPSRRTLGMLAATQIAGLGTTVTAFWAAPALAGLAILSAVAPRPSAFRTLLLGALSSAYVLGLGAYFKWSQGGVDALRAMAAPTVATTARPENLLSKAYALVLGQNLHLVAAVGIALVTWPLCRTPLARRFAVVFPLGFFAVLGNPWLTDYVTAVTTRTIYWRGLWLLPIPLLFGLAASAVLQPSSRIQQFVRVPLFALILFLFFSNAAPRMTFGPRSLRWPPHPKVDLHAYRVARALVRSMPPHRQVLAPLAVSRVLPMLHGYGHPLFIKASYLQTEPADRSWRRQLTQLVSHRLPRNTSEPWLIESLDHYRVEGVVVPSQGHGRHSFAHTLSTAHFRWVATVEGQEIWTRTLGS